VWRSILSERKVCSEGSVAVRERLCVREMANGKVLKRPYPALLSELRTEAEVDSGIARKPPWLKVKERHFLLPIASQEVIEGLLTAPLVEVTDPIACTAHVFHCDERLLTSRVGYLGERKISPRLEVGKIMFLGELFTPE